MTEKRVSKGQVADWLGVLRMRTLLVLFLLGDGAGVGAGPRGKLDGPVVFSKSVSILGLHSRACVQKHARVGLGA